MFFQIGITQFMRGLTNLEAILDKAYKYSEEKKFDVEVLLNSRLAPDQFNFIKQVQIACDTAKLCAARLANKEAPNHPDTEKTLNELKSRIQTTKSYLESFSAKDFETSSTRQITQARWEGKYLTGEDYFQQHAIPNFYFHLTTAYAILRHNGVAIGKKDYLGQLSFKK